MIEVIGIDQSVASTDRLKRFYNQVYISQFPDADERESLENMLAYLQKRQQGWYGANNYHIQLAMDGAEPLGGVVADYLSTPNAGIIEFLTIAPQHRHKGIGRRLHDTILSAFQDDARRAQRPSLDYVFAEMNDPLTTDPSADNMDPMRRAAIWAGWGYQRVGMPYVQPALSAGQQTVSNLCLIAKPMKPATTIPAVTMKSLLHDYMFWAMRIDAPEQNAEYAAMCAFLNRRDTVELRSLT